MSPKELRELSNSVMSEVMELRLSRYHTIFLANLVIERIEHPTKTLKACERHVMKIMPGKLRKQVVETSSKKSLERLEEELHECDMLEELSIQEGKDFYGGDIVTDVVSYLANKIMQQYT